MTRLGYCPVCGGSLNAPGYVHPACRPEIPEVARLLKGAIIAALTIPTGASGVVIRQPSRDRTWDEVVEGA